MSSEQSSVSKKMIVAKEEESTNNKPGPSINVEKEDSVVAEVEESTNNKPGPSINVEKEDSVVAGEAESTNNKPGLSINVEKEDSVVAQEAESANNKPGLSINAKEEDSVVAEEESTNNKPGPSINVEKEDSVVAEVEESTNNKPGLSINVEKEDSVVAEEAESTDDESGLSINDMEEDSVVAEEAESTDDESGLSINDMEEDSVVAEEAESTDDESGLSINAMEEDSVVAEEEESTDDESDPRVYLDISESVAIVRSAPADASAVYEGDELKVYVDDFLKVMEERRQPYHLPPVIQDGEDRFPPSMEPVRKRPRLVSSPEDLSPATLQLLRQNMLCISRASFEQRMPDPQPPEPSELPYKQLRERSCRSHKNLVDDILEQENSLNYFRFVDSLNADFPIEACHPMAIPYRQMRFSACKKKLAQILFKLFNHTIFYCGLRQYISWKYLKNSYGKCIRGVALNGNRSTAIWLSRRINNIKTLVDTLLHEMCHAAAFTFDGETAHGNSTNKWIYRANTFQLGLQLDTNCFAAYTYSYTCWFCRRRAFGNVLLHTNLHCFHCNLQLQLGKVEKNPELPGTPYENFIHTNYGDCEVKGDSAKMHALNALYLNSEV